MSMIPMAMYGLEVPAGDVAITARPDIPSAFRITMAAIDPSAEPEGDEDAPPRATLKVIRQPLLDSFDEDEDSLDFDQDMMERILAGEDEDDESDEDEDVNGGPSNPAKSQKALLEAAEKHTKAFLDAEGPEVNGDGKTNGINGLTKSAKAKGKMPASEEDEDEDDDEDDEDIDGGEIEEFVICTLDPLRNYQQPLDITIGEDERVWFKVSGTHSVFLTGNYVEPANDRSQMYDEDDEEDDEYDLGSEDDELDEDESMDELDELDDPRITELDEDEEVPALIKAGSEKNKKKSAMNNKRSNPESSDEEEANNAQTLDEMISKANNGEPALSKKQLKKLKKNDGAAGAAPVGKVEEKVMGDIPSPNKATKKQVSFTKELVEGPTPTKKAVDKGKPQVTLGVKTVQDVIIDDKKLGSGQAAKNGDRISMRYIGKLKDGKVFDSNKKGKPFSFKLGAGEVIKGWEIGVQGMTAGAERRITIPPHLAYGSKKLPDIPPNSTLIFDIKLLDLNKGK